ncbi:DUF4136 domain-containing protein [Pontibacter harenae]|uniref:DUF4136 domain-containing protein n=1 Tax=Pontibacter harenae TaxID=2894083 RepID=UPI001E471E00|nr:DUF4136 domain-containing protein [Pontibacter harenae]MCC9166374.1 DUF4136 domain-containing protein [Pontibacter harenae]
MMKLKNILLVIAASIFMAACAAAPEITSEPASGFRLNDYSSFAFMEVNTSGDGLGVAYEDEISLIKQEIAEQLQRRGLTQATTDADLVINLGVVVDEKVQTRETNFQTDPPRYMGQRNYRWQVQEIPVGRYNRGTLSVHLVDSEQNQLVWQGTAESILRSDSEKLNKQIREGVAKLVSEIPQ